MLYFEMNIIFLDGDYSCNMYVPDQNGVYTAEDFSEAF